MIPGFEEQLGPALQALMQGVNHAVNPDFDFQKAMKQHLATHPELIGQLAKSEAGAPGTLVKLGLGPLAQTVSNQPLSPQDQYEMENRDKIAANLASATNASTATNTLTGQKAVAGSKALEDPTTAAQAGSVAATGMPTWELASGEQKLAMQKTYGEILKQGSPITLQKIKNNEYKPEQLAAIMNSPLGDGLKMQLQIEQEDARLRMMRRQEGNSEAQMDRLLSAQSLTMWKDSGMVGSPAAFKQMLQNPSEYDRVSKLTPENLPEADKPMYAAIQGMQNMSAFNKQTQAQSFTKNISAAIAAFDAIKNDPKFDSSRAVEVDAINGNLAARAAVTGGPRYTATLEKVHRGLTPIGDRKELVYKDASGNIVDTGTAISGQLTPLMGAPPEMQHKAQTLANNYNSLYSTNAARADASLAKVQRENPNLYDLAMTIISKNPPKSKGYAPLVDSSHH